MAPAPRRPLAASSVLSALTKAVRTRRAPFGAGGGAPRRRLLSGGGEVVRVRIAYAPRRDGDPDPGEVVWTWVPYEEDPSQGKDRPVIVIGLLDGGLVGVPLTSKPGRGRFRLGRGDWDGNGAVSWAKLDQLVRIAAADMRREGAALEGGRFRGLVEELRRRHGISDAGPAGTPGPPAR